jgi:hypothetical protein
MELMSGLLSWVLNVRAPCARCFSRTRCLPSIVIASRRLSGSSGLLEREAVLFYERKAVG